MSLPGHLSKLFWDLDDITWEEHKDLVISRVLSCGSYEDIRWLMHRFGAEGLRDWIRERRGRGLDIRQLRFWELVLDLPEEEVGRWLERRDRVWDGRTGR